MDETWADDALAIRTHENSDAFSILYRRHLQRVYSYLLSRVGNVQDAQDLTAKTFVSALQSIAQYQPQGRFVAWLLGIAKHKLNDHFRVHLPLVDLDVIEADIPAGMPTVEDAVIQRLDMQEVTLIFNKLNPERAEALRLRYFADLKIREVADVMHKSDSAVKMLIARGLNDIRQILGTERESV